jgi:tartrate dehydrogenase/decarboxylase/D-malate dehydrogenase
MEAIEAVTASMIQTPDLGGKATTAQVTQAVCDCIQARSTQNKNNRQGRKPETVV